MPTSALLLPADFAQVYTNKITHQKGLIANTSFKKNDILCDFSCSQIVHKPNYLTVQIDEHKHITLQPEYLQYTNHSCNPNVFFDTKNFNLIALNDINVGDEISFFYPSTEWIMAQPFNCNCGNINCVGIIKGAAYLSKEILNNYQLTSFIQSMIDKSNE